ncbi:MAG: glycosyltransferase family 39 protein [Chthoniobacteraceae bacterium]|nr:glycosyltransferase family 39 protein [Chthoniobacteraceae bacterium]
MPNHPDCPAERAAADPVFARPVPLAERWTAALLLLAALALRCFYIFRFRYDSDEPQHLHTTWNWTQGLLQYRDFFDNHTPLFHFLFSPLVAAIGETPDILTYMRFAMVPLWAASLWAVWMLGRRLFSARAGLWGAVFIALLPWWFFPALEYRTDNLWTPLWLCALVVLLTGRLTGWRAFAGGAVLGVAACVSMKTSVLVGVSALAAGISLLCAWRWERGLLAHAARVTLAFLAGIVLAPAFLCAIFAAKGCWAAFYYCVIQHNTILDVDANVHPWWQRLAFPLALPFLILLAARLIRRAPSPALALRWSFLFLFAGLYYTALDSFWALLTRQDYLPFYPVAAVLAAPLVLWLARKARVGSSGGAALLAVLGCAEIALILGGRPPQVDGTRDQRELLGQVLQLTRPGEWVMDFKGQSVFRRRAFYYVIEPLTVCRIKRGLIEDTVARDLVGKGVCVVVNRQLSYGKKTFEFLSENYLAAGQVRVAGRVLSKAETVPGATLSFPVAIAAPYVLWADGQPVRGLLDGQPYAGERLLTPGQHTFLPEGTYPHLDLLWERAAADGCFPVANQPGWLYENARALPANR